METCNPQQSNRGHQPALGRLGDGGEGEVVNGEATIVSRVIDFNPAQPKGLVRKPIDAADSPVK